jgi:hypothetical protein
MYPYSTRPATPSTPPLHMLSSRRRPCSAWGLTSIPTQMQMWILSTSSLWKLASREPARSIRLSTRQEAEEEAAQGQMQRVAPTRKLKLWCNIEFAVRVPLSSTKFNLNGLLACPPACRSRILTLEGARYSITERKGGVGYVRDYLLPLCPLLRC